MKWGHGCISKMWLQKSLHCLGQLPAVDLLTMGQWYPMELEDQGYNTMRHRRFLRPFAAEHDPQVIKQNNENISK